MRGPSCRVLVVVSLAILCAVIPAGAAHGGGAGSTSSSGSSGSAGFDSSGSFGPAFSTSSDEVNVQSGSAIVNGEGTGSPGPGAQTGAAAGDSENVQGSSPAGGYPSSVPLPAVSGTDDLPGVQDLPSGPAGGPGPGTSSPLGQSGEGESTGFSPEGSGSPGGPRQGQPDDQAPSAPFSGETGSPEYEGPARENGWQGSRDAGTGTQQGYGASGSDTGSMFQGQYGAGGAVMVVAASAGSGGMAWSGAGHPGGNPMPADPGHDAASHRRQQGSPPQSGQYPCGPAQTSVPTTASPQKEVEQKDTVDTRPRLRRGRTPNPEQEPGVPAPSSSSPAGVPLFPFSLVLFGGYRRISKKNVLDLDTRQTIYQAIARNPGIDVITLTMVTGINENTLRYHLFKLAEAGKITCFTRPAVVRYFLNQGAYDPAEQVIWHYLWSDTPRHILLLLSRTPGLTRQQIAGAIGISGPSVTRQMKHLIEDNIIENRVPGHANHYYLSNEALAILQRAGVFSPSILQGGHVTGEFLPHPQKGTLDPVALSLSQTPRIPGR